MQSHSQPFDTDGAYGLCAPRDREFSRWTWKSCWVSLTALPSPFLIRPLLKCAVDGDLINGCFPETTFDKDGFEIRWMIFPGTRQPSEHERLLAACGGLRLLGMTDGHVNNHLDIGLHV